MALSSTEAEFIAFTESYAKRHCGFVASWRILICRPTKTGGGSSIFVNNNIDHDVIKQYSDEVNSITTITVNSNEDKINICCVYRPPYRNVDAVNNCITTLDDHMQKLNGTKTYIVEEFNFDLLIQSTANENYINMMMQNNVFFICDKRSITREQSESCIDHLHTNNLEQNVIINYAHFNSPESRLE